MASAVIKIMRSLGNHEFDNGVTGLVPFIKNLSFPVLTSNLVLNKTPELANLTNLKKSVVLEVAGRKIGIVGYLTTETKEIAVPNDVEYVDEIEAIRKEVNMLKHEGIKIIIALGHSGYLKDLEIAKKVEGVDLVIGGHSHSFLWNGTSPDSEKPQGPYPTYAVQASGKSVPVVQAYAFTKYMGKIRLLFDFNGDLINAEGTPILLDNTIPEDPDMLVMVNKYRENLLNITEEVIGYTSVVLDSTNCVFMECNLGNLITDAMVFRYAVDYTGEYWTDAPIAVIQSGGIRASLAHATRPANITKGELLTILPFGGTLVTVAMNGSVIREMIEHSINNFNAIEMAGPFLQFSGLKVTYNITKPVGSRLMKVEARCWACDVPSYSMIFDKEIYKVLMPSFVAMGGDGFHMFKGLSMDALDYNEFTSTQYYITRHSPIYPEVEGRITLLTNDTNQINTNNSSSTKWSSSIPVLIALFNLLYFACNFFY